MQGYEKIVIFLPVSRYISETAEDTVTVIVAVKSKQETVRRLPIGTIFNDRE